MFPSLRLTFRLTSEFLSTSPKTLPLWGRRISSGLEKSETLLARPRSGEDVCDVRQRDFSAVDLSGKITTPSERPLRGEAVEDSREPIFIFKPKFEKKKEHTERSLAEGDSREEYTFVKPRSFSPEW